MIYRHRGPNTNDIIQLGNELGHEQIWCKRWGCMEGESQFPGGLTSLQVPTSLSALPTLRLKRGRLLIFVFHLWQIFPARSSIRKFWDILWIICSPQVLVHCLLSTWKEADCSCLLFTFVPNKYSQPRRPCCPLSLEYYQRHNGPRHCWVIIRHRYQQNQSI